MRQFFIVKCNPYLQFTNLFLKTLQTLHAESKSDITIQSSQLFSSSLENERGYMLFSNSTQNVNNGHILSQ